MSETANLRDALAFYANPDNYALNTEGEIGPNVILDGGSKAQMILDDAEELGPTPLQAAALAALVAWREKGLASRSITQSDPKWFDWRVDYLAAQRELWALADALLAAEGGTG